MPIGQRPIGMILPDMVETDPEGVREPEFDDDAAAHIVWEDYQRAASYLDTALSDSCVFTTFGASSGSAIGTGCFTRQRRSGDGGK